MRAQRALKGMGLIGKKGKTAGVPLLVRSVAAQATFPPVKYEHTFALSGEHLRARNARPYK